MSSKEVSLRVDIFVSRFDTGREECAMQSNAVYFVHSASGSR